MGKLHRLRSSVLFGEAESLIRKGSSRLVAAIAECLLAAYWPHSTPEQRHLPLLISYRLFLALLPLALQGDEERQKAIVHEMKVVLYRYLEPIVSEQRA